MTQDDAAKLLDMSRITYHRLESGLRRIRLEEIARLCRVLQCDVSELLADDPAAAATYLTAARHLLGYVAA